MDKITILAGTIPNTIRPLAPFAPLVMEFLAAVSQEIRHTTFPMDNPAWQALAFWLRPKHLATFRPYLTPPRSRLGQGLVFHITPANMPTMWCYSWVLSLLAGNSNIVRISPRLVEPCRPMFRLINSLLQEERFQILRQQQVLLTYAPTHKDVTDAYSQRCDVRIIWGGDASIAAIRQSPLQPQAKELTFADRYSLALFDTATIAACSDEDMRQWAHRFYNDTYEADQNACSSPRLVVWLGNRPDTAAVQRRWWRAVAEEAKAYDLWPIKVSTKYADAWRFAMTVKEIHFCERYTNRLYVYTLDALPPDMTKLSGSCGQFFQFTLSETDSLMPHLTKKVQTISTIGIDDKKLRQELIAHAVRGVDRIVPVGQALTMDALWDGINVLDVLSRPLC